MFFFDFRIWMTFDYEYNVSLTTFQFELIAEMLNIQLCRSSTVMLWVCIFICMCCEFCACKFAYVRLCHNSHNKRDDIQCMLYHEFASNQGWATEIQCFGIFPNYYCKLIVWQAFHFRSASCTRQCDTIWLWILTITITYAHPWYSWNVTFVCVCILQFRISFVKDRRICTIHSYACIIYIFEWVFERINKFKRNNERELNAAKYL